MNWSLRDYNQFYYFYQCYVRVGDTSDRADMWCFLTKTEVKLVFSFVFVCLFFFKQTRKSARIQRELI